MNGNDPNNPPLSAPIRRREIPQSVKSPEAPSDSNQATDDSHSPNYARHSVFKFGRRSRFMPHEQSTPTLPVRRRGEAAINITVSRSRDDATYDMQPHSSLPREQGMFSMNNDGDGDGEVAAEQDSLNKSQPPGILSRLLSSNDDEEEATPTFKKVPSLSRSVSHRAGVVDGRSSIPSEDLQRFPDHSVTNDSISSSRDARTTRQRAKDLVEMKMQIDALWAKVSTATERKRMESIVEPPPDIDKLMESDSTGDQGSERSSRSGYSGAVSPRGRGNSLSALIEQDEDEEVPSDANYDMTGKSYGNNGNLIALEQRSRTTIKADAERWSRNKMSQSRSLNDNGHDGDENEGVGEGEGAKLRNSLNLGSANANVDIDSATNVNVGVNASPSKMAPISTPVVGFTLPEDEVEAETPMEAFTKKLGQYVTMEVTNDNALEILDGLLISLRNTLSDFAEMSLHGSNDLNYIVKGLEDEGVEIDDEAKEWLIYSCAAPVSEDAEAELPVSVSPKVMKLEEYDTDADVKPNVNVPAIKVPSIPVITTEAVTPSTSSESSPQAPIIKVEGEGEGEGETTSPYPPVISIQSANTNTASASTSSPDVRVSRVRSQGSVTRGSASNQLSAGAALPAGLSPDNRTWRHSLNVSPSTLAQLKALRRKSTMPRLSLSVDPRLISRGLIPLNSTSWLAGLSVYSDQATSHVLLDDLPHFTPLSSASAVPDKFKSFDFDQRDYSDLELCSLSMYIFDDLGVCKFYLIPQETLWKFLWAVRCRYRKNPYHSFRHCFDVLHSVYLFITLGDLGQTLGWRDTLSLLVGALAHDLDHTGTSNNFLVNTHSRLATLYNDRSVLENHHCSVLFQLLRDQDECNILRTLSIEDYSEVRKLIISSVIYTDLANHFELVSKLKSKVVAKEVDGATSSASIDRRLLVDVLLHAADLSNPFRSFPLSKHWTYQLAEEFVLQGQLEKALSLPLSPHADPNSACPPKMCLGFLDIIVNPLVTNLAKLLPKLGFLLERLEANRKLWDEELARHPNAQIRS